MKLTPQLKVWIVWLILSVGLGYLLLAEYQANGCIRSGAICNQFGPISVGAFVHVVIFIVIVVAMHKQLAKWLG